MRTNWILSTAALVMCVTAAAAAQSATPMGKPSKGKGDTMSVTYTGCLESVNHGASFLLTKVGGTESMHGDIAMKHDDTAMKGDAAKSMQDERMAMKGDKMDAMASKSFALVGYNNLDKHIGQKVSVTGSLSDKPMGAMAQDVSTLTVKTLKVIAKSCS